MLAKKKKIYRKQIKEDKLVTSFYELQDVYLKYQKQILIAVSAIAVIIVAYVLYGNKMAQENIEATTYISRVLPYYKTNQFKLAIDGKPGTKVIGLKQIVEDYGSSDAGESAKIFLANAYYALGKYDEALEAYEDYSGSIDLFEAASLAGQAACYEAKNNPEKAAEYFRKAAFVSETNPQNPNFLLQAGLDYFDLGNKNKAREMFEVIRQKYSKSDVGLNIDKYLALL